MYELVGQPIAVPELYNMWRNPSGTIIAVDVDWDVPWFTLKIMEVDAVSPNPKVWSVEMMPTFPWLTIDGHLHGVTMLNDQLVIVGRFQYGGSSANQGIFGYFYTVLQQAGKGGDWTIVQQPTRLTNVDDDGSQNPPATDALSGITVVKLDSSVMIAWSVITNSYNAPSLPRRIVLNYKLVAGADEEGTFIDEPSMYYLNDRDAWFRLNLRGSIEGMGPLGHKALLMTFWYGDEADPMLDGRFMYIVGTLHSGPTMDAHLFGETTGQMFDPGWRWSSCSPRGVAWVQHGEILGFGDDSESETHEAGVTLLTYNIGNKTIIKGGTLADPGIDLYDWSQRSRFAGDVLISGSIEELGISEVGITEPPERFYSSSPIDMDWEIALAMFNEQHGVVTYGKGSQILMQRFRRAHYEWQGALAVTSSTKKTYFD